MPTFNTLDELASFLPPMVVRYLSSNPEVPVEPRLEQFEAAVMFADISGFTALSEKLAQQGPQGAETLAGLLNSYFTELIGIITEQGGEVVKFAGDALLALWPSSEQEDKASGLAIATQQAAFAGLKIQQKLKD